MMEHGITLTKREVAEAVFAYLKQKGFDAKNLYWQYDHYEYFDGCIAKGVTVVPKEVKE